jgi:hypothetical protein
MPRELSFGPAAQAFLDAATDLRVCLSLRASRLGDLYRKFTPWRRAAKRLVPSIASVWHAASSK